MMIGNRTEITLKAAFSATLLVPRLIALAAIDAGSESGAAAT